MLWRHGDITCYLWEAWPLFSIENSLESSLESWLQIEKLRFFHKIMSWIHLKVQLCMFLFPVWPKHRRRPLQSTGNCSDSHRGEHDGVEVNDYFVKLDFSHSYCKKKQGIPWHLIYWGNTIKQWTYWYSAFIRLLYI